MTFDLDEASPNALRRRAEDKLAGRVRTSSPSEPDLQRLVHELQVHQIELDMQNEALRQSRAQTEAALERLTELNAHLEEEVAARTAAQLRSEERATQILQSTADGLYGVDADGRITFMNPAGCQLLGLRAEDVIGRSSHALFHSKRPDGSPYPEEQCPTHAALQLGRDVRIDREVFWHADGHPIPVMYAVHPLSTAGRPEGAVISFVDMSEQRAAAAAREQALAMAEHLARMRSEFVANMSHEIRTPLNGVLGFAEIGARSCHDAERSRRAFEQIKASGQQLLGVVNDILDFSKIEAGKLAVEAVEVSLAAVIQRHVEPIEERCRSKHLHLFVRISDDMPRSFLGDPLRLGQVLLNLLTNAVKFTASGSITLATFRDGEQLVFQVADTGIGIDAAKREQLFQPFVQLDGSTTRRFGGTGLGLAISKRLADLMNGHIEVHSRPGVGSTFTLRLPYVPATSAAVDPVSEGPRLGGATPLTGLAILVAEDEPFNQVVLAENLRELGARVVVVGDGSAAVDRVRADGPSAYDVVLMDVQMPKMDGYEAARHLARVAPRLPVIGQTAHAMAAERAKCIEAGMVDHIAKPILWDDLVKVILHHLAPRRDG